MLGVRHCGNKFGENSIISALVKKIAYGFAAKNFDKIGQLIRRRNEEKR